MEKMPDYSNYSLAEFLEVQQNIDRDRYPQRTAKIDAEIQKRRDNGEVIENQQSLFEEMLEEAEEQRESSGLILDFQGEGKTTSRWLFITSVILLHVFTIGYVWKSISVPEYTALPEYLINVQNPKCSGKGPRDARHYDFVIQSYGYNFYAVDIKRSLCRKLAKKITKKADVKIWHLDGIIFHMTQDDKVLLSHEYLRPHYRSSRLARQETWLVIGFIFWTLTFKSFVNALSPGTFIKCSGINHISESFHQNLVDKPTLINKRTFSPSNLT